MPDTLIIRLPSTTADAQWLLVDLAGGRLGMVMAGALSDAAPLATGHRVVVLVPGTDTLSAEPVLPLKRGAHLEQVARYALEELSASDIEDLHLAIGKRNANGGTQVVLVQRHAMEQWLAKLLDAGIVPDAIYSESDVIPTTSHTTNIIIDHGLLYLRRSLAQGATLDVQPLSEALQLTLGSITESDDKVTISETTIYVTQFDYERDRAVIDAWRDRVPGLQIKILPEGPLPLFALQAAQLSAVNLLAGPYARKRQWNKTLAPWRLAAILCGVAVLLHLTANATQFWHLARVEKQVDQQIREVVSQTLPGAPINDTRNARKQFETRLGNLKTGSDTSGLMHGLTVLSNALEQIPDARIDALAFRTKVMDLRVTVPSVDALDKIQHLAAEHGISAEIQSATPRESKVEGRLQFKANNS